MLEIAAISFVAWLLFAATSFKCRRQLGIISPATVTALRAGATALLILALLRCGTAVDGERYVRLLGGASLAAVLTVALLSFAPVATMTPVALLLRACRYRPAVRPQAVAMAPVAHR